MGRRQCRNTFNNKKNNTTPPEHSGSTTARPEHPKVDKTEEKYVRNNFMKVIEGLK